MKKTTLLMTACLMAGMFSVSAQTTLTDDFNADYDYKASGAAGIWDKVVLNEGYVLASADTEAEIVALNTTDSVDVLTFKTINSNWGGDKDNGAALVKKVKADTDFEVKVKIVGGFPSYGYPTVAYLMAGVFARVDSKIADDSSGFVALQAFDQYSVGYGFRNSTGVGGRGVEEHWTNTDDEGDEITAALYPYMKLTRVGNVYTGYCSKDGSTWYQYSEGYERTDMAGKDLQVGLYNATYTENEGVVHFDDFSITGTFVTGVKEIASNMNMDAFYSNEQVVVRSENAVSGVSVYTVDGRLVAQSNSIAKEVKVSVSAHSVYVVVVNTAEGSFSKKVAAF